MSLSDMPATWPGWLSDLRSTLPVAAHFLMTENVNDRFLTPRGGALQLAPSLLAAIWQALEEEGFEALVVHDPVDHVRVHPDTPAARAVGESLGIAPAGRQEVSLERLAEIMRAVIRSSGGRVAMVLESASRTMAQESPARDRLLNVAAKEAREALPHAHAHGGERAALFNPVVWVLDRPRDLPAWFVSLDAVRTLPVPLPDLAQRRTAAAIFANRFAELRADRVAADGFATLFAERSDGMTLRGMGDVASLAVDRRTPPSDIDDAVRAYRVGTVRNPWKEPFLRERIAAADVELNEQVLGQQRAVDKALDILVRSTTGLTAAHSGGHASRPRGVLFFAGPTGVGKTELAKAITKLVFGDPEAYTRFDMSEFSAEHSEARLIGAPPGYVGHDAGGQLTDALQRRPFGLVLFDEIEKAHPRILDKFLQVLEDGRLTDGTGQTVHFSESLIVFTSNLGVPTDSEPGGTAHAGDGLLRADLEARVRKGIEDYFTVTLGRPELLNRIGLDNIVVFDFLSREVALQLVDLYLARIRARVLAETGRRVEWSPAAAEHIRAACTADLRMGGRGVGTTLESVLTNPLARALFKSKLPPGAGVRLTGFDPGGAALLEAL